MKHYTLEFIGDGVYLLIKAQKGEVINPPGKGVICNAYTFSPKKSGTSTRGNELEKEKENQVLSFSKDGYRERQYAKVERILPVLHRASLLN